MHYEYPSGKAFPDPDQETKKKAELCPYGHENPCAWRYACDYCDKLCTEEKEVIAELDRRREKGSSETLGGD